MLQMTTLFNNQHEALRLSSACFRRWEDGYFTGQHEAEAAVGGTGQSPGTCIKQQRGLRRSGLFF